jgi:RNA polymerase sigma factor (TIGR02999 family)
VGGVGNDGGAGAAAGFDGRAHFFAAAAEAMRRILVDHARRKNAAKRGGNVPHVALDDEHLPAIAAPCNQIHDLLALDEALNHLAAEDPDKAELVKLLYFAGLSLAEAAAALGLSKTTAHRHWTYARAWLLEAMERGGT